MPLGRRIRNITDTNNSGTQGNGVGTLKRDSNAHQSSNHTQTINSARQAASQLPTVVGAATDTQAKAITIVQESGIPAANNPVKAVNKQASVTTYGLNEQDLQAELRNFEEFSRANNILMGEQSERQIYNERITGYPNPHLYDQYYINKYSFPKGLSTVFKSDEERQRKKAFKQSLYDIKAPNLRKGINGWKLTKRPQEYLQKTTSGGPQ